MASIMWSIDRSMTMERIKTYSQLALMIMLLWDLYLTKIDIKRGLQAYVWGGYMLIGGTFYNFVSGNSFVNSGRYSAGASNPNDMGFMLALGIPLAWYLILQSQKSDKFYWLLNAVNYFYIPLAIVAIILTASRTSFILILPSLFFLFVTLKQLKIQTRVVIIIIFVIGLLGIPFVVPASSFERLSETNQSLSSGDLTGRGDIWQQGWTVFLNHPIIGIGSGAFNTVIPLHQPPHNVFLAVLTESGIIGFVIFSILLGVVLISIPLSPRSDIFFWTIVFLIWIIGANTLNWEYRKTTWFIFSMIILNSNMITEHILLPKVQQRTIAV